VGRNVALKHANVIVLIVVLMLSVACASLRSNEDTLNSVVDGFHHDLRWKYNDTAVARVDPKYSADLLDELEAAKDLLFITGYEIRRVEPDPSSQVVRVKVLFSYYRMPSTVIKEELAVQTWKKINEKWRLISQEGGPFSIPPVVREKLLQNDKPPEKDSLDGRSAE
jgi:hypothetical protein